MSEYSGAPIDGLLRILVELGGDTLRLQTGQKPVAQAAGSPVRLTLPDTSNSMLRTLCGEMATEHNTHASSGAESQFLYSAGDLGRFRICIRGALTDQGQAQVAISRAKPEGSQTESARTEQLSEGSAVTSGLESAPAASEGASPPAPAVIASERQPSDAVAMTSSPAEPKLGPALRQLLMRAISLGASDVHLGQGQVPVVRCQGRLQPIDGAPNLLEGLLDSSQVAAVRAGQAVDLGLSLEKTAKLRVNVYMAESGLCAAVRILPRKVPTIQELGLPKEVRALTELPAHGLVLVCGHTGAGKSTSLAALTESRLERQGGLCISLESPIEYPLQVANIQAMVRQREVGRHVRSFASGLRDALREDPDLLLIGEMRDAETTSLALTAAETGHLVMSSLHSRSAASAIHRIVDLFPAAAQSQVRGQLADCLRAVVSQRLLPAQRGQGRVLAAEVLLVNAAVAHLIREGKIEQLPTVIHSSKEAGMLPLERDLARLVKEGKVARAAARANAVHVESFERYCG